MNKKQVINKAREMQKNYGGRIFAFPVDEGNPLSEYALVVDTGICLDMFSNDLDVTEAAGCIKIFLETCQNEGLTVSYEKDVRFIFGETQLNGPSITMRRLKKNHYYQPSPSIPQPNFVPGTDVMEDGEEILLSARGVLKLNYFSLKDDQMPKADKFITNYCRLLAQRKHGGSASQIKSKLMLMTKDDAIAFLESVHGRYISDTEVMNLMQTL